MSNYLERIGQDKIEDREEIEQLTARIERLNYSFVQETALSDRLKAASRMPGTGNYVEWIETIRNSHDQVQQLTRQRDLAVEALHYCVKQVPELATVTGIATAIKESENKGV